MAFLHVGASPVSFRDYAVHSHDCYEIIVNAQGVGTALIGSEEYPFSPGTIHIIPPNTPHTKKAPEGFRDIYCHTDSLQGSGLLPPGRESARGPILLADDSSHTVEGLMSILLARYLAGTRIDHVTETLFDAMMALIGELGQSTDPDPVIRELIHTITASYNNPEFQVTDALLATGYSKDHIRRRFVQATGQTPAAYLRSVRIRYAKKLLRQKDTLHLPIQEIALMCGYDDMAYFCRIFRSQTGMTPGEYAVKGS